MTENPRRPGGPGHLFVVHGDLNLLRCDDVLIPTDGLLLITPAFMPLLGLTPTSHQGWRRVDGLHPPRNWQEDDRPALLAPSVSPDAPTPWLVNTACLGRDVDWLVRGILTALAQAVASHTETASLRSGRERPLIALPMMGIGEGGYAHRRAQVIDAVLTGLEQAADAPDHPDVALVLHQRSDYAVIQERRLRTHTCSLPTELDDAAKDLAERAQANRLVLFLGAGVSMAAGLPSWTGLLTALADAAGLPLDVREQLPSLPPADAAEVIQQALEAVSAPAAGALRESVRAQLGAQRHALAHASLAGLRLPEAITTNYDPLYELAGQVPFDHQLLVLPRDRAEPGRPWLLKLHGDLSDEGNDLVLTREDYLKFDSDRTPLAAIVQSRLLTSHILFVGYSLADDNFIRLARQVASTLRTDHEPLVGTVLTLGPEPARQRLWGPSLRYVPMTTSADAPGKPATAARSLEIFLDHIAMFATSESSYVMDPRYAELLDEPERDLAIALHALLAAVTGTGKHHDRIAAMLLEFGAPSQPMRDKRPSAPSTTQRSE